jgi:hypothetical protein
MQGSAMQSGDFATRTENQKQISKIKYNTKSVTKFEHECAHVLCIHVSFVCNQQLAHCRAAFCATTGSAMHSGFLEPRTESQKRISKS